jgi:ferrous iron transport protein A
MPATMPATKTATQTDDTLTLANLRPGERGRVRAVAMPDSGHGHDEAIVIRLLELGFVPDEVVRVTALGPGGREPLAVQVGGTLFALRRHEAEHVRVERLA